MHSRATVVEALRLANTGASAVAIGVALGVPARTVNDWVSGRLPHCVDASPESRCGIAHDLPGLPAEYVYLLGLYLGDGCISRHPRGVYRLRITLDQRYPGIIQEALDAIQVISGKGAVRVRPDRCVEAYSYWKHWPCVVPQHGEGLKHLRAIVLADWQQELVELRPESLLRGLVQSDGCRSINTGRNGWSHPRYSFSNRSADIHAIFRTACERIGVRWTAAGPHRTYVSCKADVATLDEYIGPKR